LSEPVIAALVQVATDSGTASDVRVRAVSVLGSGGALSEPVIAALVRLATDSATDPYVRVEAGSVLGSGGVLSEPVIAALVRLAAATDPYVRVQAGSVLGSGGALSEPVIAALVQLTTSKDASWETRRDAVIALQEAPPTPAIRKALLGSFQDDDNDVRRAAAATLVELSRRHPESAAEIRSDLATSCTDPSLSKRDIYKSRTGWDYAHDALGVHVETFGRTIRE
jgi:HEAT repeat protein